MKYSLPLGAIFFAFMTFSNPAPAVQIQGTVKSAEGAPIPFVRIRISGLQSGPYSRTVFSTDKGSFTADVGSADPKKLDIDAFRIGWTEAKRTAAPSEGGLSLALTFKPVKNVADQVPASAWLKGDTDSTAYHLATINCANCHQLGSERVRRFASTLNGMTEDKKAGAWSGMVQHMRYVTLYLGEQGNYLGQEDKLRWGLKSGSPSYNALLQPETSLFSPHDLELIVPFMARHFPTTFDSYTGYKDTEKLGNYGVNADTVIDEFVLPTFGWTRELAITPGSDRVWFVETDKDRLGGLDPKDGSVEWYKIPANGPQAPHTMNPDASGNVWMTLEDSFSLGRFNTSTKSWRIYPPVVGKAFGVTHDFAYNSERYVTADSDGRIWIADMGTNEMWAVNVDSGETDSVKLPTIGGESTFHSLLYGTAIDAKHNRVWWSQIFGGLVGSIDTKTSRIDRIIPFARGDGPRRLAIQDDGTLWVPLFGSSEIVKVNGENGGVIARYRIPDRGSSPYGITMDNRRNAIWCATVNSDRIYRFDIKEERWTQYPMPRKEAYIRMIQVDKETGDVWTTYANMPPGKRDPKSFGTESANNMLVRLRPGN